MQSRDDHQLQHLGLATVCSVVYWSITGQVPDGREPQKMQRTLEIVAHALAKVVAVYAADACSGLPKPLNALELIEGRFSRGAQLFTTKDGKLVSGLTVQRKDMATAIDILAAARIPFDKMPP